jgi:hypothetical protein
MNSKIWRNTIVGVIAAFSVAISVDHAVAQKLGDAQKAAEKAQEDATKASDEAKTAQETADNAPKSDADKAAEKADQQAGKDEQAARDAQDKADASQAAKDAGQPNSDKQAADDKAAADKANDQAQKSEDAAKKADEKADKGENKGDPQKINRQKQKEKRKKDQEAWEKQRKLKHLKALTLGPTAPSGTSLAMLASTGQVKIDSAGTGETIGHIADLMIQNLTDQPLNVSIQPMILESGSGKNQHYACPKGKTVALKPHGSATVPMDGVCVNRSKPPVGKGVTGDLVVNEGDPKIPQNPDSHMPPKNANKLLRLCTSKYDAADKLQKDGALKDLPYHDKQKQKDIVVQWSTWMDPRISELTGAPPATKDDFKKVVYKQVEEQGPVTPDKKKKIDQGIDTIFEKIELTSEKAKDLEKPDPFARVELTGEEGKGETPAGPINVGDDTGKRDDTATKESNGPTTTTETVTNPDGSVTKTITNKNPDGTTTTTTTTTKTETHEDGTTTTTDKTTLPGGATREKITDLDKGGKATRNSKTETDKHGRKTMEYHEDLDLTDPNREKIKGGTKKVTVYYPDKDGAPGGLKADRTENFGPDEKIISGTQITVDPNGQTTITPLP